LSEPNKIVYSEIIWKSDSVANMLVEKAYFFVPVKIEGIKEKLYMQFDTGIPATFFHGITLNKLLQNNKSIKTEYSKDSIEFFKNPNHIVYQSDGYNYTQPFPNLRLAYKINDNNKVSIFYNRRVDRPNEVDIRIFPKYDDAEIIKVGKPTALICHNRSRSFANCAHNS
jgi:hypothetical protein